MAPDPGFEDMHKVVCVDQFRPQIPQRWEDDKVIADPGLNKPLADPGLIKPWADPVPNIPLADLGPNEP